MSPASNPGELADAFVSLNGYLQSGGDREGAVQRLVHLAVDVIDGCDWAAVTAWPAGRAPHSLAVSDAIAGAVDLLQYESGEGPCLSAADGTDVVEVADLATDDRWPAFAAATVSGTPVRAVLSIHLVDDPHRCALNLYSSTSEGFTADSVAVGALFAAHARVLLAHVASAERVDNLEVALTTSRQIGAAIGILMNARKVTNDQAFELLRASSQSLHRKLADVADEVTVTGKLPGTAR